MKKLFAERLRRARIMAGLSMSMLAESIGVSKEAINKYEKAKAQPDSAKLVKICKALEVKVDYFFRPEVFQMDGIEFRKRAKLGARKVDQLKERIKDKLERYLELENLLSISTVFKNPIRDMEINSLNDVENAALKLRETWSLGLNPIGNIVEMLEDFGIKVIEAKEDLAFDGLSAWVNNSIPIIVINKDFSIERKRFTLFHELGHLLLVFTQSINEKQQEQFCNRFSGALLMPADWVRKELSNNRNHFYVNELAELQKEWGMSIQALLYRAKDVNVISKNNLRKFYIKYNSDSNFKILVDEARYIGAEESGRFSQLLYKALAQEIISTSKAAALSNMSVSDIKSSTLAM